MAETLLDSTWATEGILLWVLLEFLETGIYVYLISGILPDIKNAGKTGKIIMGAVFILMAGIIGMKYRIGSIFSNLAFFYSIVVLILGTWAACRKKLGLIAGIVMTYSAFILLLVYMAAFALLLTASCMEIQTVSMVFAKGRSNVVFIIIRLMVLLLIFPVLYRIRNTVGIRRQILEYRGLLLIVGTVLSVLVLEYQNFLEYAFYYLPASIPAGTTILRDVLLGLLTSVVLGAAAGILFLKNRSIRSENDFLLMKEELEQQKYAEIRMAVEKNRELVHDTKNHYLIIREYVRKKDYESLENYVSDLQENFIRTDSWVYTGNHVLDLILGQKQMLAREKGIRFDLQVSPLSRLPFGDREICSLFGNLLDNALEACERVMEEEKTAKESTINDQKAQLWIQVKIEQKKQLLFIEIANSTDESPERKERKLLTRKKDSSLHGYGLKSVERIVEEHDGVIFYDAEDRVFTVKVTFFDIE